MPDWCNNRIQITSNDPFEFKTFREILFAADNFSLTESFLPLGDEADVDDQREAYGCKWGDCGTCLFYDERNGTLAGYYDTPWGPMNAALLKISSLFPSLFINTQYSEPGGNFRGEFCCQAGEIIADASWEMTREDLAELELLDDNEYCPNCSSVDSEEFTKTNLNPENGSKDIEYDYCRRCDECGTEWEVR